MNPTKPLNAKTDWSREMNARQFYIVDSTQLNNQPTRVYKTEPKWLIGAVEWTHVIEFKAFEELQNENIILNEKLKIATEALEEIGNEQYHNRWDCNGGETKCEIAREALDKLKKEK